ncbi:hypothetical protein PC114_g25952 [Phytophthora cactorum]|nr:hypothetical protein PC114_g25952 [Phytophthora cactorum]
MGGVVMGNLITKSIKSKDYFAGMAWKNLGATLCTRYLEFKALNRYLKTSKGPHPRSTFPDHRTVQNSNGRSRGFRRAWAHTEIKELQLEHKSAGDWKVDGWARVKLVKLRRCRRYVGR